MPQLRITSPHDEKAREFQESKVRGLADREERYEALLEYTAMMVDVELPEEEEDDEQLRPEG